ALSRAPRAWTGALRTADGDLAGALGTDERRQDHVGEQRRQLRQAVGASVRDPFVVDRVDRADDRLLRDRVDVGKLGVADRLAQDLGADLVAGGDRGGAGRVDADLAEW